MGKGLSAAGGENDRSWCSERCEVETKQRFVDGPRAHQPQHQPSSASTPSSHKQGESPKTHPDPTVARCLVGEGDVNDQSPEDHGREQLGDVLPVGCPEARIVAQDLGDAGLEMLFNLGRVLNG